MNLFDKLVTEALKNQPNLSSLRLVVEKELLHHDILNVLSRHHLLQHLTFIGGTCLRCCYGGVRLSEDLDFTGGIHFSKKNLSMMGQILTKNLENKYGLAVEVSEPVKDKQNVETWKIKIVTKPKQKHLPAQRINIDICKVKSYEKRPIMLLNPYQIDMGTSGLILQAQSREEIYTDKLIAVAFRPNRIKYRDLWDILWLHSQGLKPKFELIENKLSDRQQTLQRFLNLYNKRTKLLNENPETEIEFKKEMQRFLPATQMNAFLKQDNLWDFLIYLLEDFNQQIKKI